MFPTSIHSVQVAKVVVYNGKSLGKYQLATNPISAQSHYLYWAKLQLFCEAKMATSQSYQIMKVFTGFHLPVKPTMALPIALEALNLHNH